MALSADSSYVVIPVQDPFLYQWFMWQMWLPYQLAMALHSFIPCACCGSIGGGAVQNPQCYASVQSPRHGSCPGARVEIRLAQYLDDSHPVSQADEDFLFRRKCSTRARKGRKKFKSQWPSSADVRQPQLDFDDEYEEALLAYAMEIFCDQTELMDLQCDWSSPGLGFVKNEACNYIQHEKTSGLRAFTTGQRIFLQGLVRTALNGQSAIVTTTLLPSGRYGVQLVDGSQIAVRPCHMQCICEYHDACSAQSLDIVDVSRRMAASLPS